MATAVRTSETRFQGSRLPDTTIPAPSGTDFDTGWTFLAQVATYRSGGRFGDVAFEKEIGFVGSENSVTLEWLEAEIGGLAPGLYVAEVEAINEGRRLTLQHVIWIRASIELEDDEIILDGGGA